MYCMHGFLLQIRDVPDEVRDRLAELARARTVDAGFPAVAGGERGAPLDETSPYWSASRRAAMAPD